MYIKFIGSFFVGRIPRLTLFLMEQYMAHVGIGLTGKRRAACCMSHAAYLALEGVDERHRGR